VGSIRKADIFSKIRMPISDPENGIDSAFYNKP